MKEIIFAILGFLSGLFLASHKEWFSHNLKLDREKKTKKIELYRKFAISGTNLIDESLLIILNKEFQTKKEITKLKQRIIKTFDYFQELKLFASDKVFEKANEFFKALLELYEMLGDLIVLIQEKKLRRIEFIYFVFSISEDESFENKLEEIRKDKSVNKDVFSFLEKYSAKDNYFVKVTKLHAETIELMKKEIK